MDYKDMKPIGLVRLMLTDGVITQEQAAKYFPELAESEDEKIRKWLICTLKSLNNSSVQIDGAYEMMLPAIAWLEKQAEQKSVEWNEEDGDIRDNIIRDLKRLGGDMVSPNQAYQKEIQWLKSLKERCLPQPKQEWSEEDEKMLSDIIVFVSGYAMKEVNKEWVNFLKSFSQKQPSEIL